MVTTVDTAASATAGAGNTLILGIIVFAVIGIVVLIVLGFIIYKIAKGLKKRDDIFYRLKSERMKLSVAHKRYRHAKFRLLKMHKNPPIRLLRWDQDQHPHLTEPIAYYRGDYTSPEGNVVISCYIPGSTTWLFFPKTEVIMINERLKRTFAITKYDKDNKPQRVLIEKTLPMAKDIIQWGTEDVILKCDSLGDAGMFFVPVVKDANGNVIDMTTSLMSSMDDVAANKLYYETLDTWARANRKAVDSNPFVRIMQKTSQENTSIEQKEDMR